MFSRIRGSFYRTSAWRLAVRSTLVFAIGSAGVFLAMYFVVARAIQARSDSWLIGESETLKQVALSTPRDALYDRIVEEVAELASQEVSYDDTGHHIQGNTVFFAETDGSSRPPVWVGPSNSAEFIPALEKNQSWAVRSPIVADCGMASAISCRCRDDEARGRTNLSGAAGFGCCSTDAAVAAPVRDGLGHHGRLRVPGHAAGITADAEASGRDHRDGGEHSVGRPQHACSSGESARRSGTAGADIQQHAGPHFGLCEPAPNAHRFHGARFKESNHLSARQHRDRAFL